MSREVPFSVDVSWQGGRLTTARVDGKPPVDIATPPEFRGTHPETWSPEDFFVAAAASCLAVSIAGIAEYEGLELRELTVSATGVVGRPEGGGPMRFLRVEQKAELETDVGSEEDAERIARTAEQTCLVALSLATPIETTIVVRTPSAA